MSNSIKTLSLAKKINKMKNIKPVASATLEVSDYEIEIRFNGIPSNIGIEYDGAAVFASSMPAFISSNIGNNSILITNLFKHVFPVKIYNYSGDIIVTKCIITNYDGTQVSAVIKNNQEAQKINRLKTNVDNDDEILFDEPKEIKERKRGSSKPYIKTMNKGLVSNEKLAQRIAEKIEKLPSYKPAAVLETSKPISKPTARPTTKPIEKPNKPQGQRNIIYKGGKK